MYSMFFEAKYNQFVIFLLKVCFYLNLAFTVVKYFSSCFFIFNLVYGYYSHQNLYTTELPLTLLYTLRAIDVVIASRK